MGDPDLDKTGGLDPEVSARRPTVGTFGRFRDLCLIGTGGMGNVYRAYDPTLGRFVALKLIQGDDPRLASRLLVEARSQARIEHDHVCRIYEAGTEQGRPFIAMQLIEGRTLKEWNDELGLEEKLRLMKQVAEGVHAAHKVGLIHRDLKPSNVMLERGEDGALRAWVMDFGLARDSEMPGATVTGILVGTPFYMSPEQARGQSGVLDRRTDIFSLGATLYEILSGRPPFAGGSSVDVLMRVVSEDPAPIGQLKPELPKDVCTIVMKCLEKEPQRRYDSARALAEDLGRYLDGEPILARRTSLFGRLVRKAKRNRALFFTASVATLLVLGLLAYGIRVRALASEESALAAEFARTVEEARWALRVATMAPEHDVRPEKARMAAALERIKARMAAVGRVGEGPGEFALGEGELALNHVVPAVHHLNRAWELGQRSAMVAYTLGLATGQLYRRELQQADAMGNKTLRDRRRQELQTTLRDPAVLYLKQGIGVELAAPEYVYGLIAMYERRDEEALALSERAIKKSPWLYEALVVEGDVHAKRSQERHEHGDASGSRDALSEAEDAYHRAADIARSAPEVRDGLCQAALQREEWVVYTATDVGPLYQKARAVCEEALQVDDDNAEVHAKLANLHRFYADQLMSRGKDPLEALNLATEEAERALRLDPESRRANGNLGIASRLRAEWQMNHGQDPREALALAVSALSRAAALVRDAGSVNDLANAYVSRANFDEHEGKDPRADLEHAQQGFRDALQIVPDFGIAHANLGIALTKLARAEMAHGNAREDELHEAVKSLEHAGQLMPGVDAVHTFVAEGYLALAELDRLLGRDPSADVASARSENEKAARQGRDPDAWLSEGATALFEARRAEARGGAFDPLVEEALKDFGKAAGGGETAAEAWLFSAEADLVKASHRLLLGQAPDEPLAQVRAALKEAALAQGKKGPIHAALAEAFRLQAEWRVSRGQDPGKDLEDGLAEAGVALAQSGSLPEALRENVLLHDLGVKAERDERAQSTLRAAAEDARRAALASDRLLEGDLSPVLKH